MIQNKTKTQYEDEGATYKPCSGVKCYNEPRECGWCDECSDHNKCSHK